MQNYDMKQSRRKFITNTAKGALAVAAGSTVSCQPDSQTDGKTVEKAVQSRPLVISTWGFGLKANAEAMKVLQAGGSALDAVEQGVRIIEADGENTTVGYGGLPDREGKVTLDACIMGPDGKCGSVSALEDIMHPTTVARMVMERTPHVMLVGDGAKAFALSQGMKAENLLTENAKKKWEEWKLESKYEPIINVENHDTIGMLAIDEKGDIAGACTTSGLAFKMRGRVGDSPIIGAGLYVDNEVGGAAATGLGEAMLRTLGSFLVVEMMRMGKSPRDACREAVNRVVEKHPNYKDFQVGFIALNKAGEAGSFCIHEGFTYAKTEKEGGKEMVAEYYLPM